MSDTKDLSSAQCILLAASLASDANIASLRALTFSRPELFDLELLLRVLLNCLPESTEPEVYTAFVAEAAERYRNDIDSTASAAVDSSSVSSLSLQDAREKLRYLYFAPLRPVRDASTVSAILRCAPGDPLVLFLINRAHAIVHEAGLLPLLPRLIRPFLDRSPYIRAWYVSTILPLLRLDYEYHPVEDPTLGLSAFEDLQGQAGVDMLMSKSTHYARKGTATSVGVGRDLRGLVGPWTCGSSQRKRRKLGYQSLPLDGEQNLRKYVRQNQDGAHNCRASKCNKVFKEDRLWRLHMEDTHIRVYQGVKDDLFKGKNAADKIMTTDCSEESVSSSDWNHTYDWIVSTAVHNFPLSVLAIEGWQGPSDIDLEDLADISHQFEQEESVGNELHHRYCQACFAAVYAAEEDSDENIRGAHAVLTQLADLMGFEPPPNLATTVDMLPQIEKHMTPLADMPKHLLQIGSLMDPDQPLTTPNVHTYGLLQMFIYSSHLLRGLGMSISVASVSKLCFWSDTSDAMRVLQKLMQGLVNGRNRPDEEWAYVRRTILWLADWGLKHGPEGPKDGYGVLGRIPRPVLEKEILKAICGAEHYELASKIYLSSEAKPLSTSEAEEVILALVYEYFDQASNGNRTRGSMKRASSILTAFRPFFATSTLFRQCDALVTATHALSFYTLTLEKGIPTKPISIRQTDDPLSPLSIVLSQNPHSYTKLDDLINVGRNLVIAIPSTSSTDLSDLSTITADADTDEPTRLATTSRRVTGMAIEAALAEDDFETAYSYVVNRLSSSSFSQTSQTTDTIPTLSDETAWRAAFHAGRHPTSHSASNSSTSQIRRLEQRMDLLAQALTLSPPSHLPETLAAWRRCEEEMLTLLAAEADAEREADDAADPGLPHRAGGRGGENSALPGAFGDESLQPGFSAQPKRREVGRGATEEAPMGLFEVARGAARAFGRSVGDVQPRGAPPRGDVGEVAGEGEGAEDDGRVRKRDMVASAVTGGFARGVGWVLGANPGAGGEQEGDG